MDVARRKGYRQTQPGRQRKHPAYENNNYIYRDNNNGGKVGITARIPEWITCYACVGLASLLCYVNNLEGQFVHDDVKAITGNPDVLGDTSWGSVLTNDFWGKPMSDSGSHKSYRPLCILTFRLNYLFGQLNPVGYHVVNNFLHCLATVLFTVICRRAVFTKDLTASYISGLLFAVHPIHTEAVSGLVGRADLLACVFFQIALLSYISIGPRSDRPLVHQKSQRLPLCVTTVCATLALLSKENGITVLGVCVIHEGYVLWQKYRMGNIPRNKTGLVTVSESVFRVLVILVALACLLIFRIWMLGGHLPNFQEEDNPASFSPYLLTRVLTYVYLWSFNAWLILCPVNLSHDWQMGSIPLVHSLRDPRNLNSLLLLVLLVGLARLCALRKYVKHQHRVFWALVLTIIPFSPASNVFLRVGFVVAERVLYIPSMGIVILVVHCLKQYVFEQWRLAKRHWKLALILYLFAFPATRTLRRNMDWQSRESLTRAGLALLPGNAKMHYNYANVLAERQDIDFAIEHYDRAIRLWPNYASAHNNLATHLQDKTKSVWHLSLAIRLDPCHTNAYTNLADIYASTLNQTRTAVSLLQKAITCKDRNPRPYLSLAALYQNQGLYVLAEKHYRAAVDLAPRHQGVHHNIGLFYETQGQYKSALRHLLTAASLDSNNHYTLRAVARIYRALGNTREAETYFKRALIISRDPITLDSAASYYFNIGHSVWALELFKESYMKNITERSILHLAHAFSRLELYTETEKLLKNHLPDFPKSHWIIMQLANVYGLKKDHHRAYQLLKQWLEDNSPVSDYSHRSEVYHQIGNHLKDMNELTRAAEYYNEALNLDTTNADCHHNLAVYYHKKGEPNKAHHHYKSAMTLSPKDSLLKANYDRFLQTVNLVADVRTNEDAVVRDHDDTKQPTPIVARVERPEYQSNVLYRRNTKEVGNASADQLADVISVSDVLLTETLDRTQILDQHPWLSDDRG